MTSTTTRHTVRHNDSEPTPVRDVLTTRALLRMRGYEVTADVMLSDTMRVIEMLRVDADGHHHTATLTTWVDVPERTYAYALFTVSTWRLTGETLVYAPSAAAAVAQAIARGYVKAEAAPAVPVNGYPAGLPVRHGDTASHDTRTA